MQESTSAAIDEAAAIIRATLIRILSGKSDKSSETRDKGTGYIANPCLTITTSTRKDCYGNY